MESAIVASDKGSTTLGVMRNTKLENNYLCRCQDYSMTDGLFQNTRIAKGGTPLPHPLPRVRKHERIIHHHINSYDDWHRLKTATGEFNSFDGNKSANYHLEIGYDNLYNITSKKLTMTQTNLQFAGKLSAGHEFNYTYSDKNPMQLASVETKQYNVDRTNMDPNDNFDPEQELLKNLHTQNYEFDKNGNMTSVSVAPNEQQSSEAAEQNDVLKSFLWDEENRLLAVNNNGSVSCYFYDAAGERTVKLTSETEMVHVNGKKVGGNDAVTKFTAYVSPYFVVSNGGAYTKHIYAASQRIASKLGNEDGFGADPRRVEMAGEKKISDIQKDNIGARYKELGFTYSAPEKEKVEKDSTMDSEEPENLVFFYHPDHLGSTSYVTDADGNIAQHVEYIPYGEVFVEERNSQFSTNFLFNAKELDNETGLYYYGARYLDPTGAMWLSVDPVFHAGTSPYAYCLGNPVKMIDPDGRVECDENGNVNVVYDVNRVNALLQQRLNDPTISADMKTSYRTGISNVNDDGVNMNLPPTCTYNGVIYQVGIARTDSRSDGKGGRIPGREFLVMAPIRSVEQGASIADDARSNCFGLSLLGGQMGILNGHEANIVIEDEFTKVNDAEYAFFRIRPGGVALWGEKEKGYHHAARYTGTPGGRHQFVYKNNYDGPITLATQNYTLKGFEDACRAASCGYQDKIRDGYHFVDYFNPNRNRVVPNSIR